MAVVDVTAGLNKRVKYTSNDLSRGQQKKNLSGVLGKADYCWRQGKPEGSVIICFIISLYVYFE